MQHSELSATIVQESHGHFNFFGRTHAGGENQWLSGLHEPIEQRQICQVGRGNFVGWHSKTFKHINALAVPWSTHVRDPSLGTVLVQALMLIDAEFKAVKQLYNVFSTEIAAAFAQTALTINLIKMAHLELDAIRSSVASFVDHFDGALEAAVVIVADLGNHKGSSSTNFKPPNFDSHSPSLW